METPINVAGSNGSISNRITRSWLDSAIARLHAACRLFTQRDQARAHALVCIGPFGDERRDNPIGIGLGGSGRDVRSTPRETLQKPVLVRPVGIGKNWREIERQPQLAVSDEREDESRRHYADDGPHCTAEVEPPPHDGWVAPETAKPETTAQQNHGFRSRRIITRPQHAANRRLDAKQGKEVRSDATPGHTFGLPDTEDGPTPG